MDHLETDSHCVEGCVEFRAVLNVARVTVTEPWRAEASVHSLVVGGTPVLSNGDMNLAGLHLQNFQAAFYTYRAQIMHLQW